MFLRSRVRTKVREATAPGSDLRHASIDGEIHAGDERTFIGGEERDGSRDFLWLAPATNGNLRGELGGRLLGLLRGKARRLLEGWGLGWSGAHRIHADLAVFQLHSPGAREVAHSRLTRGVGAKPRQPQHVRDRRGQDNRPPPLKRGRAFCTVKNSPFTFTSKVWSKWASVASASGAIVPAPAFAKRMSM